MNRRNIQLFLAGTAVILAILACSIPSPIAPTPTTNPNLKPTRTPTFTPQQPSDTPELAPSDTPQLVPSDTPELVPSDTPKQPPTKTPASDLEGILNANGFERDKTLDSSCNTACSAYKNARLNIVADYYYTNKSFSVLYYAKDKNGQTEKDSVAVVKQLLSDLYSAGLAGDVMQIAEDFPNHKGSSQGVVGSYKWNISISIVYNLDNSINNATIYILIVPIG